LQVRSEVGQGTTFWFEIAVETAESLENHQSVNRRVIGLEPDQPHFRILVVDDQVDNRQLLVKLLSPLGFELQEADNGEAAIAIWKTWQPHLILMDLRMPILGGIEATEYIRRNSHSQTVKIVAITASSLEEERSHVLAAGCDGYIRKPFKQQELFDILYHHIGVQFVYEESVDESGLANPATALMPADLKDLPADLIAHLHQAVLDLDIQVIQTIIAEIGKYDGAIASALSSLVNQYQYESLFNLTQPEES
jgi:CheY-like chemotaxis protein